MIAVWNFPAAITVAFSSGPAHSHTATGAGADGAGGITAAPALIELVAMRYSEQRARQPHLLAVTARREWIDPAPSI